jgi:hypothetical protein
LGVEHNPTPRLILLVPACSGAIARTITPHMAAIPFSRAVTPHVTTITLSVSTAGAKIRIYFAPLNFESELMFRQLGSEVTDLSLKRFCLFSIRISSIQDSIQLIGLGPDLISERAGLF